MKFVLSTSKPTEHTADALVAFVAEHWEDDLNHLDAAMQGTLLPWLRSVEFKSSPRMLPTLGHLGARQLLIVPVKDGDIASAAAKAGRALRREGLTDVGITGLTVEQVAVALEHLRVGDYTYDQHKPEGDRKPRPSTYTILGHADNRAARQAIERAAVRARWQDWARDLVNGPPAEVNPESLVTAAIERLGGIAGVSHRVYGPEDCREEGMVGIVAVGQGSPIQGRMLHLTYDPGDSARDHIALVGKGVTFDSGGLSLKPSGGMQTMRSDMGGAATVLAAFGAAAELAVDVRIECLIGAVENMNDGHAYKLGDILHYRNGVTVEIHNTDAEGRLVLADCLINASRIEGVSTIVDAATLTGACVIAVGGDFTGMFTANDELAAELSSASEASGDGVWRLPLHQPYKDKLKGHWGQIKNVGGREAGATTAALFLQYFVRDDVRWCHLDIAGASWNDSGDSRWAPGATGQMVRALASWIEGL